MIEKDFGDWLNPMVVKELRQGLRGGIFVTIFLFTQALMIFSIILAIVSSDPRGQGTADRIFWTVNYLLFVVALPLTGLNAHSGEVSENTLELVLLTGLTPFKVLIAKWESIVARAAIMLCSVLPYVALRYFTGGINPVSELGWLAGMFIFSAALTALSVIGSVLRSMTARLIVFGITFFFSQLIAGGVIAVIFGEDATEILLLIPLALVYFFMAYSIALARMAAPPNWTYNTHHD